MGKICRICGKTITGEVLKHYEEKHFSIYVANKAKIQSHPGAFVISEGNEIWAMITAPKQKTASEKKKQVVVHQINNNRLARIIDVLKKNLGEQTFRGTLPFVCDGCSERRNHGKVILGGTKNLHLCYDCYKQAKEMVKSKRGNKHVFINTPM